MIPNVWPAIVLALAVFRIVRFVSYDEFPPLIRARSWATREFPRGDDLDALHYRSWTIIRDLATRHGERLHEPSRRALQDLDLEYGDRQRRAGVSHGRPTVAKLISCYFCLGFWISVVVYVAWRFEPRWTLYVMAPWALSAAVGLIAKQLDP